MMHDNFLLLFMTKVDVDSNCKKYNYMGCNYVDSAVTTFDL